MKSLEENAAFAKKFLAEIDNRRANAPQGRNATHSDTWPPFTSFSMLRHGEAAVKPKNATFT